MTTFKTGDRVRDRKWGGRYVGTVRWDGAMAEDQMRPDEVEPVR